MKQPLTFFTGIAALHGARVYGFYALLLLGLGLGCTPPPGGMAADSDALQALREQRREAAHQQRRIIFNNDADDALIVPVKQSATAENLLKLRTTALAGTQVDTIFYCSLQGDTSLHRTKVGEVMATKPASVKVAASMMRSSSPAFQTLSVRKADVAFRSHSSGITSAVPPSVAI